MDLIIDNYLVIIIVGFFFVFALVGYLIDMLRNNKEKEKEEIPNIKPVEIADINLPEKGINDTIIKNETKETNDADDLLKNYDENINE